MIIWNLINSKPSNCITDIGDEMQAKFHIPYNYHQFIITTHFQIRSLTVNYMLQYTVQQTSRNLDDTCTDRTNQPKDQDSRVLILFSQRRGLEPRDPHRSCLLIQPKRFCSISLLNHAVFNKCGHIS